MAGCSATRCCSPSVANSLSPLGRGRAAHRPGGRDAHVPADSPVRAVGRRASRPGGVRLMSTAPPRAPRRHLQRPRVRRHRRTPRSRSRGRGDRRTGRRHRRAAGVHLSGERRDRIADAGHADDARSLRVRARADAQRSGRNASATRCSRGIAWSTCIASICRWSAASHAAPLAATIEVRGTIVHVLAAHLGLRVHERRFQVRQILEYLDSVRHTLVVVLGDFNDWLPGRSVVHVLDDRLGGRRGRRRSRCTGRSCRSIASG